MGGVRVLGLGMILLGTVVNGSAASAQNLKHVVALGGGLYEGFGAAIGIADRGVGIWARWERRLSGRWGVDMTVASVRYVSSLGGRGTTRVTPVTMSPLLYLESRERFDVYLAPVLGLARVTFNDWPEYFISTGTFDTETSFAWGGAVGLNVRLGQEMWVLAVTTRYLTFLWEKQTSSEYDDATGMSSITYEESPFGNLSLHIGVGYRF